MVRFEYRLTGRGWSAATISARGQTAHLSASFLSDALGDLARAVIALLRGAERASLDWQEEPGDYRWLLTREAERLVIRVLWFDDTFSRASDDRGRLVFETECRLMDFAGQLKSQLQYLLEHVGSTGYKQQWVQQEFPLAEYETLRQLLRSHPAPTLSVIPGSVGMEPHHQRGGRASVGEKQPTLTVQS